MPGILAVDMRAVFPWKLHDQFFLKTRHSSLHSMMQTIPVKHPPLQLPLCDIWPAIKEILKCNLVRLIPLNLRERLKLFPRFPWLRHEKFLWLAHLTSSSHFVFCGVRSLHGAPHLCMPIYSEVRRQSLRLQAEEYELILRSSFRHGIGVPSVKVHRLFEGLTAHFLIQSIIQAIKFAFPFFRLVPGVVFCAL